MLLGWYKWNQPCSLGSVSNTVHNALKGGHGTRAIAMLIIKHVLKCAVEQVLKESG